MKRFIPKLEKTDGDYKLWGLSIPKLPNGHHIPQIIKRDKTKSNAVIKKDAIKHEAVVDKHSTCDVRSESDEPKENNTVSKARIMSVENTNVRPTSEPEPFADIVFSFFSSTDQHYVVHRSNGNYADVNQDDGRCKSEPGGEYEIMTAKVPHLVEDEKKIHKSELTFYVSAASLKGSAGSVQNYDLPRNSIARSRSSSIFITQHRSLNDLNDPKGSGSIKYQNSASLDNLSRVCNISLHNASSKRSIASLPEMDTAKRQRKDNFQNSFEPPEFAKASTKSDYSSRFDGRGQKLKNRLSAIYTSHKVFKGRKRFSKAWHGIKEWFEVERSRIDKVIHKKSTLKVTNKSSDDYPESDFSEYEDIEDTCTSNGSCANEQLRRGRSAETTSKFERKGPRSRSVCNSVYKLNMTKDKMISDNARNGSLRQSISQPSVLIISEPVLVKINCESVDNCLADNLKFGAADRCSDPSRAISENGEPATVSHPSKENGGFAELKNAVKEGSAACKELFTILQQRADAERQYASSILRIGARARRGAKGYITMATTSKRIAIDMEMRAQLHRQFSNQMIEEIIRPLQRLVSTRDIMRKQIERDVDITARRLSELRTGEARMKKLSHSAARFNERIQDANLANGLTPSQEIELRKKKIKSEEAATKSDVEYYTACLRAERARVEWETTIKKCSETLVNLENERFGMIRQILKRYVMLAESLGPGLISEEAQTLEENFDQTIENEKHLIRDQLIQPPLSMHLPDFYCQHITLAMNKERRKEALLRVLQLIKIDMERERKSKQALEKLSHAMCNTPNFGANDSQQNVSEKLYHMRSILTYLEGARIQAAGALSVLIGRERTPHPLSPHLKVLRDRRGLQHTTLTIPPWLQFEYKGSVQAIEDERTSNSPPSYPNSPALTSRSSDRGAADGVSMQHYSDIDDNLNEDLPERPPPPKFDLVQSGNLYDISAM